MSCTRKSPVVLFQVSTRMKRDLLGGPLVVHARLLRERRDHLLLQRSQGVGGAVASSFRYARRPRPQHGARRWRRCGSSERLL